MCEYCYNPICYFAESNFRTKRTLFGIKLKDRLHHFYILGKTGAGKTNLLKTKTEQDILFGNGICLIDVHGDLISSVIKQIPNSRQQDVIYLDATNPNLLFGYNPLRKVSYEKRALVASNILEVFQRLWGNQGWGVKLSHILRNTLLTLLDQPSTNFSEVIKILHDSEFRNQCLPNIVNPDIKNFWIKEFKNYGKTDLAHYIKIYALGYVATVNHYLWDN